MRWIIGCPGSGSTPFSGYEISAPNAPASIVTQNGSLQTSSPLLSAMSADAALMSGAYWYASQ